MGRRRRHQMMHIKPLSVDQVDNKLNARPIAQSNGYHAAPNGHHSLLPPGSPESISSYCSTLSFLELPESSKPKKEIINEEFELEKVWIWKSGNQWRKLCEKSDCPMINVYENDNNELKITIKETESII